MTTITTALRTTVRVLVNGALVAIVVIGGLLVASGFLGLERYVITSGSMAGTIDTGALVLSRQVPVSELAVGDVITYLPPAESGVRDLVTHRITAITVAEDGVREFRTQGDANRDVDPWTFRLDQPTQAVAAYDVPGIGYVFLLLGDRTLRILLIGVPAAIVTVLAARDLVRAVRERRAERDPARPGATATRTTRPSALEA